jgi:cell division transport system permease protein
MFAAINRVLNFGLQNFWRNIWLSVVTVTIISLSLFSVSMLGVLTVLSNQALNKLEEKIDIAVYLKPELKTEQIQVVKNDASTISGVKSIDLVTPEQALMNFREREKDNPLIAESLLLLGNNPLGASLIIKANSQDGYQNILKELQTNRFMQYIQDTHLDDYSRVISSVQNITGKIKNMAGIVSLLFIIITLLMVFNTIRINIYTHREEIGIMRLVGASSWFIRAPFWVESVIYALLATLVTAVIFFPLLSLIQPYVAAFFNGFSFDLVGYFRDRSWWFFGSQFIGAVLLNILASTIAMRKYLKV